MEKINDFTLAPICLFTYNRLEETKQTVEALKKNFLAKESKLIIFSDGPRENASPDKVLAVREYLKTINGFKSVEVIESSNNKGLANSIIDGVTKIINIYGRVIVLEDDLITSANFLNFMNSALSFYEHNKNVISVCGFNMKVRNHKSAEYPYDVYWTKRAGSWGWGTWQNIWNEIEWEINDFEALSKNKELIKKFNEYGSDLYNMLKKQYNGEIDSWAIRFCYYQFKRNLFSIYPFKSKIKNIGFSKDATNTDLKFSRFKVELEDEESLKFDFLETYIPNSHALREFKAVNGKYNRIFFKALNYLFK